MKKYKSSVQLNLMNFKGKVFKSLAELVRAGVKNAHGFSATSGISDLRLESWAIVIRFATQEKKQEFINTLQTVLNPQILKKMQIKDLTPTNNVVRSIRWVK